MYNQKQDEEVQLPRNFIEGVDYLFLRQDDDLNNAEGRSYDHVLLLTFEGYDEAKIEWKIALLNNDFYEDYNVNEELIHDLRRDLLSKHPIEYKSCSVTVIQIPSIESRRDFFRNVAQTVIPILGLAFSSSLPGKMIAATLPATGCQTDCMRYCSMSCVGGCADNCGFDCSHGCKSTCGSSGGCGNECFNNCYTLCNAHCKQLCQDQCTSSCRGKCTGCSRGCAETCSGNCSGDCYGCCKCE